MGLLDRFKSKSKIDSQTESPRIKFEVCVPDYYIGENNNKIFLGNRNLIINDIKDRLKDFEKLTGIKVETSEMPASEVDKNIESAREDILSCYAKSDKFNPLKDFGASGRCFMKFGNNQIIFWPFADKFSSQMPALNGMQANTDTHRNSFMLTDSGRKTIVIPHEVLHTLHVKDYCGNPYCIANYTGAAPPQLRTIAKLYLCPQDKEIVEKSKLEILGKIKLEEQYKKEEEKKFKPLDSLLRDNTGTFPRREKEIKDEEKALEEQRKREMGEFGKEKLDEKAMEGSAKMFEKAEEQARKETVPTSIFKKSQKLETVKEERKFEEDLKKAIVEEFGESKEKALEKANQIGKELEAQGHVAFGKKAYNQTSDNCFDIACLLADRYGYEHPKSTKELTNVISTLKERQLGWRDEPSIYEKPSEACLVIRSPEGTKIFGPDVHVAFELSGKEFNYGPGTKEGFGIERRIYLRKSGDVKKALTSNEISYIKNAEELKKNKIDILEIGGKFFENAESEARKEISSASEETKRTIAAAEAIEYKQEERKFEEKLQAEKSSDILTAAATTALALPITKTITKEAIQPLKCSTCGKVFVSEAEYYNAQMHPCVRVRIRCPYCGSEDVE